MGRKAADLSLLIKRYGRRAAESKAGALERMLCFVEMNPVREVIDYKETV